MNPNVMVALQAPFYEYEYEWRVDQLYRCGTKVRVLCYVTNRAIQNRLDEVFGVFGWQNEYQKWPDGSVLCGISVWDAEKSQWITKWDGSENTKIEAVKGGLSGAMKRTAVQFGIGRMLYELGDTIQPLSTEGGQHPINVQNVWKFWDNPILPDSYVRKEPKTRKAAS